MDTVNEWMQSGAPSEECDPNWANPLAPSEARCTQVEQEDLLGSHLEQVSARYGPGESLDDYLKLSLSLTDDSDNETIPNARACFDSSGNLQRVGSQADCPAVLNSLQTTPSHAMGTPPPFRTTDVEEGHAPFQRHIFSLAPPPKRAREYWKPGPTDSCAVASPRNTSAGHGGDLLTACTGFIETLGNLSRVLPCCGYSLEDIQLVGDATQRQQCPNPECGAFFTPNGQSFGAHWDMLTALAKLRISCSTPTPVTPPKSSRSASEHQVWDTPGLHSPQSSHFPASHARAAQSNPIRKASTTPFMHTQHTSSIREEGTPTLESIYQVPPQYAKQMETACYSEPVALHSRRRPNSGSFMAPFTAPVWRRSSHVGSTASTPRYSAHTYSSHLSKDLATASKCMTAPVSAPFNHDTGWSACNSQHLSDGQEAFPMGNENMLQPMYRRVAPQEAMFPGVRACESAPVCAPPENQYIPPDALDLFGDMPFPQYGGVTCAPGSSQAGCEWTPQVAITDPVQHGEWTGDHHLAPTVLPHTDSAAGQDDDTGALVPWQKLRSQLVAGVWDCWPNSCIPGVDEYGQRLQVYFAGRKHPSISGVVQLQRNQLLHVPVGNRVVGLHLKFSNVAARWCLPFEKPKAKEGSTQRRPFSKASINLAVSVHVSALGGCAGNYTMGTAPPPRPHELMRTLTLQVYVLRHGVEHKKVQQEERLPETILDHFQSPAGDSIQYKHSLKGVTRKDVTVHLDPVTQGPVEVEFRDLDFEDTHNQEKLYLFVVGILHNAGASAQGVHKIENGLLATQLLVPTICVSKRRRITIDYIEQAVSKLGYDWQAVSACRLY